MNGLKFIWYGNWRKQVVRHLFATLFLFLWTQGFGQHALNAGFQISGVLSIGTHHTNLGIKTNAYVAYDVIQLNIGSALRYHRINLGGRNNFFEFRHHLGLVGMFGPQNMPVNFQFDGVYHQSQRAYSLGYMYLLWQDNIGTTQRSGAFNLGIAHVDIYFENDILAGQGRDRFRTGFVSVSYRNANYRMSAASEMWTGETRGSEWDKTPGKKMPGGYRNLSHLPFGRTSHGIAYLGFQQQFSGIGYYDVRIGVDDDNVRHFLQNRLSHDLIFLPGKVTRHTPHYPRLDAAGNPVFDKANIRPYQPYFQVGLNDFNAY